MNGPDATGRGRSRAVPRLTRGDLLALVFLAVLAFAFHGRLLLAGRVRVGEDVSRVQGPLRSIYVSALRQGRLPIWYPRLNLGTPLLAESQLGPLHPVNLAVFGLLPSRVGGVVWTVLLCFLCGAFMYLFAREIGLTVAGRTVAGLVFMMSGFFLAHVNHLYTFLLQGVHVPLALLLAERIATGRGRWAAWWAAVVFGLAVLAGHFQLTFMALLLYLFYGLWRILQVGRSRAVRHLSARESAAIGARECHGRQESLAGSESTRTGGTGGLSASAATGGTGGLSASAATGGTGGLSASAATGGTGGLSASAAGRTEPGRAGTPWHRLVWLAAPLLAAAGLSAVQWMPTWELAGQLVSRVRVGGEMHPGQMVAYVSPYLFQSRDGLWGAFWGMNETSYWESLAYVGILPLGLVGVAWGRRRAVPMVKPLVAGALLFTLLSMGAWLPTYRLLLGLPGFGYFRASGRYIFGAAFCLAALAGVGVAHAAARTPAQARARLRAFVQFLSAAILLALLVGLILAFWVRGSAPAGVRAEIRAGFTWALLSTVLRWAAALPAAAVAVWAFRRLVRGGKWAPVVAVGVVAADLFVFGLTCERVALGTSSLREIDRRGPVSRRLPPPDEAGRVLCAKHTWPIGTDHDLIYFGAPNLPAHQSGLWELPDRPYDVVAQTIRAYGVRYIISDRDISDPRRHLLYGGPDPQIRAQHGRLAPAKVYLYRCRQVRPRAYLVDRARYFHSDERNTPAMVIIGREMTGPRFDPSREVLLEGPPDTSASGAAGTGGSPGTCRIVASEPTHVGIDVKAARPAWLVLSDLDYPGWVAAIDGKTARIRRANVMVRAVRVPAGRYAVTFDYRPRPLWLGIRVSVFTLGALLAVGLVGVVIGITWGTRTVPAPGCRSPRGSFPRRGPRSTG